MEHAFALSRPRPKALDLAALTNTRWCDPDAKAVTSWSPPSYRTKLPGLAGRRRSKQLPITPQFTRKGVSPVWP